MPDWLSTADHAAAAPAGPWMNTTDHSSEAPGSDTGHPQLGPSPTMAKVGNTIFQDIANAPARIMNFLSGHPLQDTLDAIRQSTAARQVHKQRAVEAYKAGDYKTAADQAFFGSVPFLGPALGAAADEYQSDHKPEAVAHAVEILGPALADPAMNGLESEAAARAGAATTRGAQAVSTAAGGALKGAAKSSIQTIPYGRVNIPIPAPIVGAWAGGSAAAQFGLPRALGAAIGGGLPLVRGAIAGAREALAARMVANPGLLDATAQLKYGKAFKDLEATERGSVITAAGKASGKNVTLPDSVTEELTRPSEVAPPIQSTPAAAATAASAVPQPPPEALAQLNSAVRTPARSQNPAPAVQPPAAMLSRLNNGVTNRRAATAAENLFSEMRSSGSVPPAARPGQPYGGEQPPPDRFVQAARQARAAGTEQLAGALRSAGIRSSDLPNVTAAEWEALAKAKNISWPIGIPARRAWVQDIIDGVRRREGQVQ